MIPDMPNPPQAIARPSGRWWAISFPDIPGVHAQSRTLDGAQAAAAEALGLYVDKDPEDIVVVVTPDLGDDLDRRIRQRHQDLHSLQERQHQVAHESRSIALELTGRGLSQRDVAHLLGVSFQRVSQLVNG